MNNKRRRKKAWGSEEEKERTEMATAVLEPKDNGQDQAVAEISPPAKDGRPPKPSEDAEECPNWEKGRHRTKPWLQCQGWSLNGHEVCKHCASFQREAPIFRSVDLETITQVLSSARNALERVVDPFKGTQVFIEAWEGLEGIVRDVQSEHESRGRDYSQHMRRVEALVPSVFAEEARRLLSKCESLATKQNGDVDKIHSLFHEWEAQVKVGAEGAEINGVYPRWIFAGKLRYLYRGLAQKDGLNYLVDSIQQGPRRNARRNGGNGWDPNRSWRPRRR